MSASDALSKMSASEKAELMDKVKTQVFVANAQEMLQKITEKCFQKCVTKPGTYLDSSDNKCLSFCMDRFMDVQSLVSRVYAGRVQRESGQS